MSNATIFSSVSDFNAQCRMSDIFFNVSAQLWLESFFVTLHKAAQEWKCWRLTCTSFGSNTKPYETLAPIRLMLKSLQHITTGATCSTDLKKKRGRNSIFTSKSNTFFSAQRRSLWLSIYPELYADFKSEGKFQIRCTQK